MKRLPNTGTLLSGRCSETAIWALPHAQLFGSLPYSSLKYSSALSKALLPIYQKQGHGKFIVISSIAGLFGFYSRSTYSAAKHALHGYFDTLRLEEENNGISVLIVCPGKIKTHVSNNALLSDGATHNILDNSHQNAMSAEECAERVIKAHLQNKEQVLIGGKELLMVYFKRYIPAVFSKLLRKVKRD